MSDVFTKKKRSEIMSHIRGKNTKLESDFLKKLSAVSHVKGYRYRKHYSKLLGKPDIAFIGRKIAVFIDGCFWHGCKKHCIMPKSNKKYWEPKIARNIERDKVISRHYKAEGWRTIRIREHDLKRNTDKAVVRIENALLTLKKSKIKIKKK